MITQEIHFILQGKGGVGKSFVASNLAQYFVEKRGLPHCNFYDTDPVNHTFEKYRALGVKSVEIIGSENTIDIRKFDSMINALLDESMKNKTIVIDNGASSFLPLIAYMKENGILELFSENSIKTYFHVVLSCGQAFNDTLSGLEFLNQSFNSPQIVLWINQNNGKIIESNAIDIEHFLDQNLNAIKIDIPYRNADLFGADIANMTLNNLTYREVAQSQSDDFQLMSKRRLALFKNEIFDQLSLSFS